LARQWKTTVTVGSANADYITDGTADNVQIQQAIDFVNTNGGGIVDVYGGDYDIASTIEMKDNVLVRGQNQSHYGNITQFIASSAINMFRFSTTQPGGLVDVKIDGNTKQALSGVLFEKNALAKIKGAVLRNVFIEQCQTGIESLSTGITSGPFDDVSWYNIRLANCTVGIDHWSVTTNIFGGVIGGCTTGVYARNGSGLKTYGIVFTSNTLDFDLGDQTPFSYSINDSYFESSEVHIRRSVTSTSSLGSFTFKGSTFLNTAGANPAFDFTYATGRVTFDNCRFASDSPNSNIIATNANTFVTIIASQTAVEPAITGTGRVSIYGTSADIRNSIINRSMDVNGGGAFWTSAGTNIYSVNRQATPANASVVHTALGGIGFKAGTSTPATSNLDLILRTNGIFNIRNAPTYADDASAGTGGLVAGDVYKTATGELRIKL
jgi:hypothetical protein